MYLKPDGKNDDQVKSMHKEETTWATSIISGGVKQKKVWNTLNSAIPQTLKYPLHVMTLN